MAFSLNDLNYEKDSKERMPWEHYTQEFAAADPKEIASRLSIPYDEETKTLTLTFAWNTVSDHMAGFYSNTYAG